MTDKENFILANARVVLPDAVIERGFVAVADGRIAEIGEGPPPERGHDLAGDLLIPGLVELHTDHLEAHYAPPLNRVLGLQHVVEEALERFPPFRPLLSYNFAVATR